MNRTILAAISILGLTAASEAAVITTNGPSLRELNRAVTNLSLQRSDVIQVAGGRSYRGHGGHQGSFYGGGGHGYGNPHGYSSGYRGYGHGISRAYYPGGHNFGYGHGSSRFYGYGGHGGYGGYGGYGGHGWGGRGHGFGIHIGF